jgi:hypothetical protein
MVNRTPLNLLDGRTMIWLFCYRFICLAVDSKAQYMKVMYHILSLCRNSNSFWM